MGHDDERRGGNVDGGRTRINHMFSAMLRLCAANSSWRAGPEIGNSDVTPRFRV